MEFSNRSKRNTVLFAMLTLAFIGFTLVASTWQILRQQETVSLQHMGISARSIAHTVENSYRRNMMPGMAAMDFFPRLQELFMDVETGNDILFIEIFDERGLRLVASRKDPEAQHNGHDAPPFLLGAEEEAYMRGNGEWHGITQIAGEPVFVLAYKFKPSARPGMQRHRQLVEEQLMFVVVGMRMERHDNMYKSFRHNAFLQSLYILAAAIFVWAMALSLISRRSMAGKARFLERFQAQLLDNLPDGLITVGDDGHIQAANHVAHELLNFSEGALVGKKLSDLPETLLGILEQSEVKDGVLGWRRAEVLGKQLEILTTSFKGESDEPILLMLVRNRTRLHNLERSLAEAEKMAAVGTLAAGVAHEIRNPLAALRGFAQYFAKKFAGQQPDEEYASTMVREADRLNRVITDLLYLARNKGVNYSETDLGLIAGEVEKLLRFELDAKKIRLKQDLKLEYIWADEDAVKQALLNLMLNSIDAIEEFREKAGPQYPQWQPAMAVRSYKQDDWAVLEVEDNGIGMGAEQKAQAFEAFFTSKAKGTGLGLALVHKTLHEHGGMAQIESEALRGCRIKLFFPLAHAHGAVEKPEEESND